jgi:ABC-type uncharacterized transport system ATPase subunit
MIRGNNIMIEINNISKSYNGKIKAVDNLNLTIPNGEIFGFWVQMVQVKPPLSK